MHKQSSRASQGVTAAERRRYHRLRSIIPVQLQLIDFDTHMQLTDVLQGYSQDLSAGGLSLQLLRLTRQDRFWLDQPNMRVTLKVHVPSTRAPIAVDGHVAWIEPLPAAADGARLGIAFDAIDAADRARLVRYAQRSRWVPRLVMATVIMLVMTIGGLSWQNHSDTHQLRAFTLRLQELSMREHELQQQLALVQQQQQQLEMRLVEARQMASSRAAQALPFSVATVEAAQMPAPTAVTAIAQHLEQLTASNRVLQAELREVATTRAQVNSALVDNMYEWVRVHQHPATGLVISYEGDASLKDWAFTYDQALMTQGFLLFHEPEAARACLRFFATQAQRVDGGFVNAYDAASGAVREYTVHTGPNVWLGLAALQYQHMTGDRQFVPLAESIAVWVEALQQQDADGGVRGGPQVTWYSTEHNLDAFALFTMLHELTGKPQYQQAAARIAQWLTQYAHGRLDGQVNRGRGDATIATDTFAWSIAALGPARLVAMGFDPDKIMAFAKEHCHVRATVTRPEHPQLVVEGFDFSKPTHVARGGVISTEWTAQMIVAMQLMVQYHQAQGQSEEAQHYQQQAAHYMAELDKLIIASPCPLGHAGWAQPYASHSNVATGHGWRTARGDTTGSTSGTIYAIFAHLGHNPLTLYNGARDNDAQGGVEP